MQKIVNFVQRAACNEHGATAVEYGLVASLIAIALIGAIVATGGSTEAMWDFVAEQYKNASGG